MAGSSRMSQSLVYEQASSSWGRLHQMTGGLHLLDRRAAVAMIWPSAEEGSPGGAWEGSCVVSHRSDAEGWRQRPPSSRQQALRKPFF